MILSLTQLRVRKHRLAWQALIDSLEPKRLQLGDSSPAVQSLQLALQALFLFYGKADGYFCPATESAVASLQAQYGLPTSGVFDAATWYVLTFEIGAKGAEAIARYQRSRAALTTAGQ